MNLTSHMHPCRHFPWNIHTVIEGREAHKNPAGMRILPTEEAQLDSNPLNSGNMFIRPSAVFLPLVTLSSLVAAAPGRVARGDGGDGNVCGNKNLQCCTSTYEVCIC